MTTLWDLIEPIRRKVASIFAPESNEKSPPSALGKISKKRQQKPSPPRAQFDSLWQCARAGASEGTGAPARPSPSGPARRGVQSTQRKRKPKPDDALVATPRIANLDQRPRESMQDRYDRVVREMLVTYGVRVRRWRKSMSGVAWQITYRDGRVVNLLESPRPRSPLSLAIFLHEIGHHAIGLGAYKPRCLEEFHAWKFALDQMSALGLPVTDRVHRRVRRSLEYAVAKASRRGIREIPPELHPYIAPDGSTS